MAKAGRDGRPPDRHPLDGRLTPRSRRWSAGRPPHLAPAQQVASLTPREEKILRLRFGIGEASDHTLEEVGKDFSVTRERIRQIEAKALSKLRKAERSKQLREFVED